MKTGLRSRLHQWGVSLIELLIGVAVGLFIVAGALAIFTSAVKSSTANLAMTQLDQELRAAMDIMVRNMRRAGYYGRTPTTGDDLPQYGPLNPFQINGYQMTLSDNPGAYGDTCDTTTGECPCISFSYDLVGAGHSCIVGTDPEGTTDDDEIWCATHERFGFRYDSADDAIEMRNSSTGPPVCTETGWVDITDDTVTVDGLTFQYESRDATDATKPLALNLTDEAKNLTSPPGGCPSNAGIGNEECLQMRTLIVTIDAHLANDPGTTMSIRERVKIRNDRYCTEMAGGPSC